MCSDKIVFSKRSLLEFFKYEYSHPSSKLLIETGLVRSRSTPTSPRSPSYPVSPPPILARKANPAEYATFGKFSQSATDAAVADLVDVSRLPSTQSELTSQAEIADPTHDNEVKSTHSTVPRPSRRVREAPGGKDSINISEEGYEETDALSIAPPRNGGSGVDVELERMERMRLHVEPVVDGGAKIEEEPRSGS